jgi:hypothetical protein
MAVVQSVSSLPVNILQGVKPGNGKELTFRCLPDSKFQMKVQDPKDDETMLKSIRIPADPRFREIKHFAKAAEEEGGHYQRMMQAKRGSVLGGDGDAAVGGNSAADMSFAEVARLAQQNAHTGSEQFEIQGRQVWQQCFESSVSRLLVDFDLTTDAQCRLNHLDRMHLWFTEQGGKQQRTAKEGPSYLTSPRGAKPMPGSTGDFSRQLNGRSLMLAGAYQMHSRSRQPDGTFLISPKNRHPDGSQSAR